MKDFAIVMMVMLGMCFCFLMYDIWDRNLNEQTKTIKNLNSQIIEKDSVISKQRMMIRKLRNL